LTRGVTHAADIYVHDIIATLGVGVQIRIRIRIWIRIVCADNNIIIIVERGIAECAL
jgi:hypothetical protein